MLALAAALVCTIASLSRLLAVLLEVHLRLLFATVLGQRLVPVVVPTAGDRLARRRRPLVVIRRAARPAGAIGRARPLLTRSDPIRAARGRLQLVTLRVLLLAALGHILTVHVRVCL